MSINFTVADERHELVTDTSDYYIELYTLISFGMNHAQSFNGTKIETTPESIRMIFRNKTLLLAATLTCALVSNSAHSTLISESDFGGDFAGDVFDGSISTDLGTLLSGMTTTISGTSESGTPSDALLFTVLDEILSVTVSLTGAGPAGGGFGVSFGTGSVISYITVGGAPDIFGSSSLAVPSVTLIGNSLAAGSFYIGLDDANAGINYEIAIEVARSVPEPTTLALVGLALAGIGYKKRKIT